MDFTQIPTHFTRFPFNLGAKQKKFMQIHPIFTHFSGFFGQFYKKITHISVDSCQFSNISNQKKKINLPNLYLLAGKKWKMQHSVHPFICSNLTKKYRFCGKNNKNATFSFFPENENKKEKPILSFTSNWLVFILLWQANAIHLFTKDNWIWWVVILVPAWRNIIRAVLISSGMWEYNHLSLDVWGIPTF